MSSGAQLIVPTGSQRVIEKLPPEIRLMILEHIPTLPALQAFIHASPSYHAIYIANRANVLFRVLQNDMSPEIFLDALCLQSVIQDIWDCQCLKPDYGCDRFKQHAEDFIRVYESDRIELSRTHHKPDLDGLIEMARLHWVVHLMSARYSHYALSLHPVSRSHMREYEKLLNTETNRIHRAMYRFNIYCGLLSYMHQSSIILHQRGAAKFSGMPSGDTLAWVFCRQFSAWEVEEMICIRDYLCQYYGSILEDVAPEIIKYRPFKNKQYIGFYIDACRVLASTGLWSANDIMNVMERKPEYYRSVVAKDIDEKMWNVEWNEGYAFQIDFVAHKPRLILDFFGKRGVVVFECPEASKQQVQYEGDHRGPSKGWTWATKSKYHAPAETVDRSLHWLSNPLTSWGYVFWDSGRLEKWGLLDSGPEWFVTLNEKGCYAWDLVDHDEEMNRHVKALEKMDLMELVHRNS